MHSELPEWLKNMTTNAPDHGVQVHQLQLKEGGGIWCRCSECNTTTALNSLKTATNQVNHQCVDGCTPRALYV